MEGDMLGGDAKARSGIAGTTGGGGAVSAGKLQEILLQWGVCLLSRREITALKFLTQVSEESRGTALLRGCLRAFRVLMMVPMASHCTLLEVLLERRKIRLSRREIAGLEILG
jgi:hypothetical protein